MEGGLWDDGMVWSEGLVSEQRPEQLLSCLGEVGREGRSKV